MTDERTILEQAIDDYLLWMIDKGYSQGGWDDHRRTLNKFLCFVKENKISWKKIFTLDTLKLFQEVNDTINTHAIRGISQYLFHQKRIPQLIPKKEEYRLPDIYEEYLAYYKKSRQSHDRHIKQIKRVLAAFHDYLKKSEVNLPSITIEQIDAFFAEFNIGFAPATCKTYRSFIKGFLNYLYHERNILKKNLAPLIVGAPVFGRSKPPNFLRPHEVQELFDSIDFSSQANIRTYAILHLAYTLGLRPKEICLLTLDNIFFSEGKIIIENRKYNNPITLPLPENVIKAIAAYIIGVRPKSEHRILFLNLNAPYNPVTPSVVNHQLKNFMRKVNAASTPYWLRHTYAQNLLEADVSIYEIKQMLGHDTIESTKVYLHIHISLMRKVLFNETI